MPVDAWASEDLPVLRAVRQIESEVAAADTFDLNKITAASGMEADRCAQLVFRLVGAGYIDGQPMTTDWGLSDVIVTGLTERGRRAVGQWPSEDPWAALVDLLGQQIADEPDPVERGKLQRFLEGVLSGGKAVGVGVMTKYIEQQAGLG